ncbi:hypothetical protein DDZ13_07425 [Coraliomargarita sinensis]|uniref:Replication-associated protein ORF2/G2P domain-containing protein n=2 Tax=Coraliomargarita sinensis TaxID=2174842 RepID=A0A317ZFJ9_9BACT|nr:hypothetical protein DDZ13_07425 [Coraliomargarita sinensis]
MSLTYLKPYVPASWFHPLGIHKVLKRFWHRLPNVAGCLFVTFTIDREAMRALGYGPSEAFDLTRDRIRRIFYLLRKGVEWNGIIYRIPEAYCTKVEFHADEEGWPHFHCIWLTRRFIPAELLAHLWSYGRTNVKRITNDDFHYLLKYVCKSSRVPEWVQDRERMRIFQPSKGFLISEDKPAKEESVPTGKKRPVSTIRERLHKWSCTATIVTEDENEPFDRVRQVSLYKPFQEIFDRLVYAAAVAGRYLGSGKIQINRKEQLYPWLTYQNQHVSLPD